ncbi:unnamed protein product [Adineta steineri]|uniref:F-box domain-containing protein n=2 Tax=Adineta steineri TaxID=433720 RepID=A0A814B5P0_9BILA|nr:unnamed protein product [Adineta steineri]CAF0923572.1 unnamed protein product [Adineta steineri]
MANNRKKSDDHGRTPLTTVSGHNNKDNLPLHQTCDINQFRKEHPFLSKLLREDGILFECDSQAPSPSKDYGQLQVTMDKVILRWWKITLRHLEDAMYPGEIKDSYEDFYHDEVAQREIWRIFGQATLDYCLNLVRGKFDWLALLPLNVQLHILSKVNLDDIPQLSSVSKSFRELCRNNDLWRIFYVRQYGGHALENKDLIHLAERRGWRHVFFTNRLKLQMQLRREAQLERHHPEDPSDFVKARERRSLMQPSPPGTPKQQQQRQQFVQPSIRRHSFATRQEPPQLSFRTLRLHDQEESHRMNGTYSNELDEQSIIQRSISPSLSVKSNAGSVASTSSAYPPVHTSYRPSTRQ